MAAGTAVRPTQKGSVMEIQPGRVTVDEGIVFGTGGGRALRCDVYVPPQQADAAPAVLLVHGGSWDHGDRTQLRGYGIQLARYGFVCVASEYRLSGEAQWPAPLHDVKTALRWMRAESGALGIDPTKICLSGNSAGAHLVLMAAGTANRSEFEGEGGHADATTDVAAVIAYYPPTGLEGPKHLTDAVQALMGADSTEEDCCAASPVTYASAEFPPTMLLHGTADEVVPHAASLRMHGLLEEAGVPVELHLFPGAPHAFDAIPEFGRPCVGLMTLFFDRHVVNPRSVVVPAGVD